MSGTVPIKTTTKEWELKPEAQDGITSLSFSFNRPELLGVSSWDSKVRIYNAIKNQLIYEYSHEGGVLCCNFINGVDETIVSGGLDKTVRLCQLDSGHTFVLGEHAAPVRSVVPVVASNGTQLVASGSWDQTIKFWDPRARTGRCIASSPVPGKVFSMSAVGPLLVAGLSGRQVVIFDINTSTTGPAQRRESSLKYQTRAVQCFPDGRGFALSSIEGRVAIEYFDPSPKAQEQKYAFKCHRTRIGNVDTVYPVNALAFHKPFGTLASGGCDGSVYIWDLEHKKRVAHLHKYPTSIAALAFNETGSLLAVASSYTFEEGEKDSVPQDQVFIREVQEFEVKPKAASA